MKRVVILLCVQLCGGSLLDWLLWTQREERNVLSEGVPLMDIPFEELAPEEKFLVEARKITGLKLSQLDTCQHKLVLKLKSSCGSLSEEDLAKLSVNLLNCQSAVEGRLQYPCTDDTSLKDCTKDMSGETWNAYHVISNRARAVCYAARQEQFRALSEMTVNKLMSTAHAQISAMSSLQESQGKLEKGASVAVDRVVRGQREALRGQEALKASQSLLAASLSDTTRALAREADIVQQIRANFSSIVSAIRDRLDEAVKETERREFENDKRHKKVVEDLKAISGLAAKVWDMIDESAKSVASQHETVSGQLEAALAGLSKINASVEFVSKLADKMRENVESKLGYLADFVGENGERLESAVTLVEQSVALAVAMLLCSFLDVSPLARWSLVVAAPLNLYATLGEFPCLSLASLYAHLAAMALLVAGARALWRARRRRAVGERLASEEPAVRPYSKVSDWLGVNKGRADELVSSSNGLHKNNATFLDDEGEEGVSISSSIHRRVPNPQMSFSTNSVAGSCGSTWRTNCSGITKTGQRCRKFASRGLYCSSHTHLNTPQP